MCPASEPAGPLRRETRSAPETEALGAELAKVLVPGDVVLIVGELGTGKTTLVRGACRALGVLGPVTSPTFTIGHLYEATAMRVSHLDLYRLAALSDEDPGLLDDYLGEDLVTFVEWPERAVTGDLGRIRMRVRLTHAGEDRRAVELVAAHPTNQPEDWRR